MGPCDMQTEDVQFIWSNIGQEYIPGVVVCITGYTLETASVLYYLERWSVLPDTPWRLSQSCIIWSGGLYYPIPPGDCLSLVLSGAVVCITRYPLETASVLYYLERWSVLPDTPWRLPQSCVIW